MDTAQAAAYRDLAGRLTQELKQALAKRDTTLLGVVLIVLLAWPDCCFRSETVVHPRTRNTLARSEEHTSELQSLMRISYAVFCLKKKKTLHDQQYNNSYKRITTNRHSNTTSTAEQLQS